MKQARAFMLLAVMLAFCGFLSPEKALAWPGKLTSCTSCHSTAENIGTIATAINGVVGTTVTVAPGGTFEVDWKFNGLTPAGETIAIQVAYPTGWTLASGTANSPAIAGWSSAWDAAGGVGYMAPGGKVPWSTATQYPNSPLGNTIDYANSAWGAGGNTAAFDDAGAKDLDGQANVMGADVRITVPGGTANGTYYVEVQGVGHVNGGGTKGYISQTITVTVGGGDTVKPTVTAFTATTPVNSNVNIPVTAFTASDNTGVTGYLITANATPPAAGAAGWTGIAPTTYTAAAGDGTKSLYPWAKDAAGNVSLVYGSPASVLVDATAPNTGNNAPAGWQAANVNVTLTPADGTGSGVATTEYCVDAINACAPGTVGTSVSVTQTAGTAGVQYVRFRSIDNVGNVEPTKSATVQIDKSSPSDGVLAVTPGNTQNSLSWTSASDSGSGLSLASAYDVRFLTGATPPTCATGTSIYTGTALNTSHTGLSNGIQYSYRVCAYDAVGNVSTGATGSGTPLAVNTQPNAPPQAALVQYQNDGSTVVATGKFTNSASPVLKGTVTDPDGDTVQLEVEIQLIASPFTNTPNCTSGALVASGATAQATCGPLSDGRYKWQARSRDSVGATSAWVQY